SGGDPDGVPREDAGLSRDLVRAGERNEAMNEQTLLGGAQPAPVPYATYARLLEQVRELRDETHIAACDFFIGHGACPAYEVVTIRLDAILAAETPAPEPTPSIIAADRLEARAVNHRNAGRKDLAEALEQAARDRRTIEEANSIVTKALWGIERPHGDELAASIRALVALAAQREPVAAPAERPTTFGQWASKITQHGSDVPQINVIGRPAETPTGLTPLLTMSEREYGPDGVSVRWQVWDEQIR